MSLNIVEAAVLHVRTHKEDVALAYTAPELGAIRAMTASLLKDSTDVSMYVEDVVLSLHSGKVIFRGEDDGPLKDLVYGEVFATDTVSDSRIATLEARVVKG